METNPVHIAHIIAKCFKNEPLEHREQEALDVWMNTRPENKALFDELMANGGELKLEWLENLDNEAAWQRIEQKQQPKNHQALIWRIVAAVVLVCSVSLWLYNLKTDTIIPGGDAPAVATNVIENDVLPAHLGAKIILANGQELKVNDTLNMTVGTPIISHDSISHTDLLTDDRTAKLHTLIVPSANFFKITLSDGTAVWVNAASELRFPEHFGDTERRVYLKGEAYFEVAKDTKRPFFVETEEIDVRVLGTHFNVSAYNKRVKTSLAEGSVEVLDDNQSVVIRPGQSAEWSNGNIRVRTTDLQRDLAWKNNIFYFKHDNIVHIANELKRWYNLDVSLSKDVSLNNTYSGEVERDVNLSEVLAMLEFVGDLEFTLNTNKLLIKNKHIMR